MSSELATELLPGEEAPRSGVREEWSSDKAYGLVWKLRELWRFRDLLWALTARSIKGRYKQSLLGISWAVIQPLAMTVIFTIVFSKFAKVDTGSTPYPVFSYAALLPWQLFNNNITKGSTSIVDNGGIVKKLYFPREVCVISAVLSSLVDFAIAAVMLVVLMIIYGVPVSITIGVLPLVLLILLVFSLGAAFFLAAVNASYRDIGFGLPLLLQIWMYLSPVVYPISSVPERYRPLYMLNPLVPIIDSFRRVIVEQKMPDWPTLWPAAALSLVVMVIGYWYFKRAEGTFADIL